MVSPDPFPAAPPPAASSRGRLLQALLAARDLPACAAATLAWLASHARIQTALCLGLAGERVSWMDAIGMSQADLGDLQRSPEDHPVLVARRAPSAVPLEWHPGIASATGGGSPGIAYPLRGRRDGADPLAILAVWDIAPGSDVAWAADALARRLGDLVSGAVGPSVEPSPPGPDLRALVAALPDPVVTLGADGRPIALNPAAHELLDAGPGAPHAAAVGDNVDKLRRVLVEGCPPGAPLRLTDPRTGTQRWCEPALTVGGPVAVVLRDVTDLRRAAEELARIDRELGELRHRLAGDRVRLDFLLGAIADPIIGSDPSGQVTHLNAPAERLLLVPPGGGSKELRRAVRANDARFSAFLGDVLLDPARQHRAPLPLVDPETLADVPAEALATKIVRPDGVVDGIITIIHDRTEARKTARLYEQLRRSSAELEDKIHEATAELVRRNELLQRQAVELEQASAMKSQFVANISHEFRTPLNAILGYTSMLLGGVSGELAPAQRRYLARVDSNANHLLGMINEILDYSRIEAGKMPVHMAEFSVRGLVREIVAELEPVIARSNLTLTTSIPAGLPRLRSDRQKLKQILLNLLSNAIKFTPKGSVEIYAAHDDVTDQLAITVEDTGIGIPLEDQARIFEEFRQASGLPGNAASGTGLGLAICRRLAGMLGGQIALSSDLGEGSTFTVVLPRRLEVSR